MYIIIPLALIFFSALGIFFIVWRRRPAFNRSFLSGGDVNEGSLDVKFSSWKELLIDFFPEANQGIKNLELKEHMVLWLLELEKSLRKLRLFFLKVDRISEILIKKIRKNM